MKLNLLIYNNAYFLYWIIYIQSTPVISRQLGAKIRERELSGSPVISRFRAKAQTRDFHGSESHIVTSAPFKPKQYVEQ